MPELVAHGHGSDMRITLFPVAQAPEIARTFVRHRLLRLSVSEETVDNGCVITSELVTNVLRHVPNVETFHLCVSKNGLSPLIECWDPSPIRPVIKEDPIDTQEMVRLYVDEQLSVREIANRYGRSYGKIYSMLRNRVIMRPANRRGPRRSTEYRKVAAIMHERIITGDWPPNRKILSQNDLALIFGVGLPTIRAAITHLRQRGYLMTKPNKSGVYVRPPQDWETEQQG